MSGLTQPGSRGKRLLYPVADHGVGLLLFYVLATSKAISGQVPTCDRVNSWRLYSTASLGHQAAAPWPAISLSHIILTLTDWVNQPLPYPNNAQCQTRKRQVPILKSLVWLDQGSNQLGPDSNPQGPDSLIFQLPAWETGALLIRPLSQIDHSPILIALFRSQAITHVIIL